MGICQRSKTAKCVYVHSKEQSYNIIINALP